MKEMVSTIVKQLVLLEKKMLHGKDVEVSRGH